MVFLLACTLIVNANRMCFVYTISIIIKENSCADYVWTSKSVSAPNAVSSHCRPWNPKSNDCERHEFHNREYGCLS
jgi:hypothetical protein